MLVYADLVIRYILLQLLWDIFLYFLGVLSYSTIIHYILDVFDNPTLAYEIVDEIGNFILHVGRVIEHVYFTSQQRKCRRESR